MIHKLRTRIRRAVFFTWYGYGQRRGFMSPVFCWNHDTPPFSDAEEFAEPDDYCVFASRIYTETI